MFTLIMLWLSRRNFHGNYWRSASIETWCWKTFPLSLRHAWNNRMIILFLQLVPDIIIWAEGFPTTFCAIGQNFNVGVVSSWKKAPLRFLMRHQMSWIEGTLFFAVFGISCVRKRERYMRKGRFTTCVVHFSNTKLQYCNWRKWSDLVQKH